MKIRYLLLVITFILVAGITGAAIASSSQGDDQASWNNGGANMQDSGSGGGGDIPGEQPPADETPVVPPVPGAIGDFSTGMPGAAGTPAVDTNLQNALSGYADYEVSYDTSLTHAENTPPELKALGVSYAEVDDATSEAGQRTLALEGFDLVNILRGRYQKVEDEFASDPEKDFAPDDPDRTLNYFQPRFDPFIITDLIPDELKTETEGTGLEGTVDPDLLRLLGEALVEANLRVIPISVIGTIKIGERSACMYSIYGMSSTIWEGESQGWWGFGIACNQISENFVVFTLFSGSATVVRTFHVNNS
ncbi:MAG: hypothetical protein NTY09_04165 [bacterium]|nr:hypothetical protein [bacterium]